MSQYFNETKLNEDATKKLIVACADANRAEVEKIVSTDANIRKTILEKNNQGDTALHVTATGGDHYILQMLLENGGDLTISDKQGRTPLMKASLLGNLDCVQVVLSFDSDNIFLAGSTGQLPLHCACLISHLDLVSQFIDLDPTRKTIKARDNEGNTPFLAASNPPVDTKVLDFLIQNGSDVNEMNEKDETALLIVAKAGATKALEFLLDRGAVFRAAKNGMTPLHEVSFRRNPAGVKLFLQRVPDLNLEAQNSEGETALSLASAGGDVECCRALIERGANVNHHCLHAAVKFGRPEVIDTLLAAKANINGLNTTNETPLFLAVEEASEEIVAKLLEAGADISIKCPHSLSKKGPITAPQLAKLKKNKEIKKMLDKAEKEGCFLS